MWSTEATRRSRSALRQRTPVVSNENERMNMTTMITRTTRAPVIHERDAVAGELQALLVDLVDLTLQAKQAHWNVVGPLFKPLHDQFDALATDAREWTDFVAERLTAIGVAPDWRVSTVAKETALDDLPPGPIRDSDAVALLTARLAGVAERTRARMDRLGPRDAASQDVVIEILQGLEKNLWMLRVQHPVQ